MLTRKAGWPSFCPLHHTGPCHVFLSVLTTPAILAFSAWLAHPLLLETWLWGEKKET